MNCQTGKKELTPKGGLRLLYVKKLIDILHLEVYLDCITTEECRKRLEDKLEESDYYTEAKQYILNYIKGRASAFDYMQQLKAETNILLQIRKTSLEPLELPDALGYSELERAQWELKVLENLLEKQELAPKEELQLLYAIKLIIVLNLEVDLDRIYENECGSRLEDELAKPGYCEEVRQYLQEMLHEMTDEYTSNYWGIASGRRYEVTGELFGNGFLDPPRPSDIEDDPRYPMLKELWWELKVLKRQLESTWTA